MGTVNPVRIRLRYADLDSFVEKFAPNVTRGGVFLASRNVQPVASVIDFEIQLIDGTVALAGQGKVTWVKEFNPAEPNRPYGMGVQFINVVPATRAVLARILRSKGAGQPPPPRGLTGMHATLGAGSLGASTAGVGPNGKPAPPFIDTTVDLAGEYGIDEAALRQVLDRRRMSGGRTDDDLTELLRREPEEPATLAQALSDLPRLLDPQSSRRRATGGFRPVVDAPGQAGERGELHTPPATTAPLPIADSSLTAEDPVRPSAEAGPAHDPAETTVVTEVRDAVADDEAGAIPATILGETSSRARSRRSGRHKGS